jgi:hypothetical protein
MILEQEIINGAGEIEVIRNPLYNINTISNFCRSYKVNRDGVELLRYCNNRNGCHGRGWLIGEDCKRGLGYIISCPCLDKTLEKLESKNVRN